MNSKEQAERECRAQWIRETSRDVILARESRSPVGLPIDYGQEYDFLLGHAHILASRLWDRYVDERDRRGGAADG